MDYSIKALPQLKKYLPAPKEGNSKKTADKQMNRVECKQFNYPLFVQGWNTENPYKRNKKC